MSLSLQRQLMISFGSFWTWQMSWTAPHAQGSNGTSAFKSLMPLYQQPSMPLQSQSGVLSIRRVLFFFLSFHLLGACVTFLYWEFRTLLNLVIRQVSHSVFFFFFIKKNFHEDFSLIKPFSWRLLVDKSLDKNTLQLCFLSLCLAFRVAQKFTEKEMPFIHCLFVFFFNCGSACAMH